MRCPTLLATDTRTGGAIDTVTGLGAVLFGGSRRNSFADYLTQTSSGTVTEQGTYANGSFSLSTLTFSGQAKASFSSGQTVCEAWSGNDTFTASASGSTSYTDFGQGAYARGRPSPGKTEKRWNQASSPFIICSRFDLAMPADG